MISDSSCYCLPPIFFKESPYDMNAKASLCYESSAKMSSKHPDMPWVFFGFFFLVNLLLQLCFDLPLVLHRVYVFIYLLFIIYLNGGSWWHWYLSCVFIFSACWILPEKFMVWRGSNLDKKTYHNSSKNWNSFV